MQTKPGPDATSTTILTFLIADVRGYTSFTAERGDEAAARLARRFAEVAREGVETFGGRVIELRGDEALAVFDSARQAIRAAVELQRRFVDETVADPGLPFPVGIGLDAGEAVPVEGGYRGGALNLAARLCSLAGPAEILASREVVHLARKVEGVTSVERGPVALKGIPDAVHVVRLRAEAADVSEDIAFRRALGPAAIRLAPPVSGPMVANPYKGLRAFEEGDAPDFFGREELTAQLAQRLAQTRFLAVVGPSGSGKSSVVRAGLIPALRRGAVEGSAEWPIVEVFPGARPLDELGAALLRVARNNPPGTLMDELERDDHGLLRAIKRILPPDRSELVLVIDQFEEVFTLVEDEAVRTHFLESLEAAVTDPHSRLRVVITLRADFYDRPLLYRGFAELLRSRVEAVVPLSPEELERVIAEPARRVDVRLEPGLVSQMLTDVASEPGALPLLEYALTELFERRDGNVLTLEAYRAIGGVSGALGRRAEELFADLDQTGQEAAQQVFMRLVALGEGTEDTRRPVPRAELLSLDVEQQGILRMIDAFGAARLISFDRDSRSGTPTVEVAHEALLTAWGRLRRWIDEAREDLRTERRLAAAAREWEDTGRDPSFLAVGSRLEQFEAWQRDAGISTTPEEREFLEASAAERDRRRQEEDAREEHERALERRSVTRLRALVAVLAVAALVAGGLMAFAFRQRGRAERESRVAEARALAAAALANLEADPERSILLALEAADEARPIGGSVLREAEAALHQAVGASRIVLSVPGLGGAVDWTSDGKLFVTEGPEETGLVDIRDARTGRSVRSWKGHGVDLNFVAFSPDGSMLATTGDDGALRVWDVATGRRLQNFQGPTEVTGTAFSPTGALVAASWTEEGEVRVFEVSSGDPVTVLKLPQPFAASFSPDGERLAVASIEDAVGTHIFDVRSGRELFSLDDQEFGATDVDWSPNGRWIATAAGDFTARIWDAKSGANLFTLFGHISSVDGVDWSADSTRLATAGSDGTAKVWEIDENGGQELLSLSAQDMRSGVWGVAMSPDGNGVITGDGAITAVKIWDVGPSGDAEWRNLSSGLFLYQHGVAFLSDDRLAASGPDGSVRLWDIQTGKLEASLVGQGPPGSSVDTIRESLDGKLVAGIIDGLAQAWDVGTGRLIFTVGTSIDRIAWSPDGKALAATSFDDGVTRVVGRSGQPVTALVEETGFGPGAVGFSADGKLLATGAEPKGRPNPDAHRLTIWDWGNRRKVRTIRTQVQALAFDPAGARIAVANAEGAELWNLEDGRKVTTLAGGTGGFFEIDVSPDGSLIAAGGFDGTVRVWDAASAVEVLVLRGHGSIVTGVDFSPDGKKLASASAEGNIRVWALDLDDLIRIAKGELTRGLTDEECRQYLRGPCPAA
ncbi:MAG: AAA family ATPase [Actinomycetota bacterium]